MTPTTKIFSIVSVLTIMGSSNLYADNFQNRFASLNQQQSIKLTFQEARAQLAIAIKEMTRNKVIRDKAKEAWKQAKLSGNSDQEIAAYDAYQSARKAAKTSVSTYRKLRKVTSTLKFSSEA